ncbi:hypothetical protein NHQ30_007817 [Ciborinia camelliae]|nr:hypothetical protein NHQ30_007817 [Ciborinia camelliae]
MSLVIYLSGAITLALLLVFTSFRRSQFPGIPRVGKSAGFLGINLSAVKKEFLDNGHLLLDEGYHKYRNEPFTVQTQDMERLILPPKYLIELRMLPETKLNHSAALVERWLGHYSGGATYPESTTKADNYILAEFMPDMAAELSLAMSEFLKDSTSQGESKQINTYTFVYSMVLAVSSRVFVGLPLARNKAWLDTISAYLAEVVATADALRSYPHFMRTLLRPFLAPKSRMEAILSKALEILGPAIQERQNPDYKANDLLGYLIATSEVVHPKEIILKILVLNSAALHTSTMVAVHVLHDLCERPQYFSDLRTEIKDALQEDGSWQFSTTKKLRKLDSFMKESMRYNQPNALSFDRIVLSPHTLSSGLRLPRGTFISMAAESMSRDPMYYERHGEPNTFNPSRFYQAITRTKTTTYNPLKDFTNIEPGNLAWGNGRQTCPGRWYAGAVIKLVVASLLEGYRVEFPPGQSKRKANLYSNAGIAPNPEQEIWVRKLE